MSLITNNKALINALKEAKDNKQTVGFVPTMGFLHEGHQSLIKKAVEENDIVVVSIFVNPTQFAPNEDFDSYPRDIERDYKMAREAGADIVYHPDIEDIYPNGAATFVEVEGDITKKLCGASRPSHFKGVTTVVHILFNIVMPDRAYFGQKDAQQVIVVKKMVKDLHMKVDVVVCPIVRELDGLAMSSRNVYLSQEEREQALVLNRALHEAQNKYKQGEVGAANLKAFIIETIQTQPLAKIDYVEILDGDSLEEMKEIKKPVLVAVAVKFGKTRLIDNIFID
ncbi:MAG: pantoate--beta-alanine ligase [Firmicutes bacterium HGW-Firmicutes-1]|jgi:pantoate--beta-alanine ligase|nr:MAG: pantoate--beta-alanine ligase [Firmicutes bacterium HGW-Firmicutes-1]